VVPQHAVSTKKSNVRRTETRSALKPQTDEKGALNEERATV
jgi:hypothetical protein